MSFVRLTIVEMRRAYYRRLVRWMIAVALLFCAIAGLAAFLTSADAVSLAADDTHPARMAAWWTAGTADGFLTIAALFLVVGAVICGASYAGAEWRAGTVTTTLTWEPSRVRLHVARTVSAAVLSLAIGVALQIVFLASLLPAVFVHGSSDGSDAAWWRSLVLAVLRIGLITSLVATLAMSIATIGRNTSAALVAIAAWALVVERVVVGFRPQLARFMISENVATVVPWVQIDTADFERPPVVALTALGIYLALFVVAATMTFSRRDIAAAS